MTGVQTCALPIYVSCINCYNGSINVSVYGGSGAYVYSWADDSLAGLNRTGLGAGNYVIDVRDTNICSGGDEVKENIVLKEPPSEGWSMEGNANINANQFIGTTDERDLIFKANNQERLKLGAGSNTTPGKINITGDGETSRDFSIGRNLLIGGSFRMDSLAGEGFKWDSLSNKSYKLLFADEEGNVVCKKPVPNISPSPCSYDQIGPIPWLTNGNVIGDNESSILGTCNYKPIYIRTNGEHRMIITENGNIGIGTTNPSTNFHVVGNSALMGNVGIGTTNPQDYKLKIDAGTSNGLWLEIQQTSSYGFGFKTTVINDDTKALVVEKVDGNESTVNFLVYGNGRVFAREITVKLSTLGDFVFAKNYKLITLNALEEFIKKNNHLPGIPSATDVNNNGLNVGEFQNLLLQKVEELTLYIIELNKQLDLLKKDNEAKKLEYNKINNSH